MINTNLLSEGEKLSAVVAKELIKTLGIDEEKKYYKKGIMPKTNSKGKLINADSKDARILIDLYKKGFLIYYVMENYYDLYTGEFKAEFSNNLIKMTSYLCISNDLYSYFYENSDDLNIDEASKLVDDEVESILEDAIAGYVLAFVVSEAMPTGEFGTIGVKKNGEGLIRVF